MRKRKDSRVWGWSNWLDGDTIYGAGEYRGKEGLRETQELCLGYVNFKILRHPSGGVKGAVV